MPETNPTGRPETVPQSFARIFEAETAPEEPEIQEVVTPEEEPEEILATDEEDHHEEQAEDDSETEPGATTWQITAGGKDHELTEEELRSNASKGLFFTQEMQKLRAKEQEFETQKERELSEYRQQRDAYAQTLPQLQAALDSLGVQPPSPALADTNPNEYTRQKAAYDQWASQRQAVEAEQQRIVQEQQAEYQQMVQGALQRAQEQIASALPQWKDEETRTRDQTEMREVGLEFGFAAQELDAITDPRAVLILHELMTHRRNAARGQEKVATAKKVVTPGAGRTQGASKRTTYKKKKAAALGTAKDRDRAIAGVMADLLNP